MPRDSSGNYTLPDGYLAVGGETIQPSQHNPPLEDIASALTGSLPRSGSAPMLAPLKLAEGSESAPSLTFNAGTGTGLYRLPNGMGVAVGGVKVAEFGPSGLQGSIPIGALMPFAGSTGLSGWILCSGQAVSRTTYAALFAVISTTFGAGDGTTTFNVPDLRGRVIAGLDNIGGVAAGRLTSATISPNGNTVGASGGAQTHTLTSSELPANIPNSAGTTGTANAPGGFAIMVGQGGSIGYEPGLSIAPLATGGVGSLNASLTTTVTINPSGGGAHLNVQPTMLFNYLIYAGI